MRERSKKLSEKLLVYLVEHGLLTDQQADQLREKRKETGKSVREMLVEGGAVSEEKLIEALAAVFRMPTVRLYEQQIPQEVRQMVRADLMRDLVVLPFAMDPDEPGTVLVALNDPMNMRGRDLVGISSKCRVKPYLATTSDILLTIDRYFALSSKSSLN